MVSISATDLIDMRGICRDCGCDVARYTCNSQMIQVRPEASEWDWWVACTNASCKNHYGEGVFQGSPTWIGAVPWKPTV